MQKISKKFLIATLAISLGFLAIFGMYLLTLQKKPKAPQKEAEVKKEKTVEEILRDLTPKEAKPLTEEEKKEIEETLKSLTPKSAKPMTPEEARKIEEILKNLTPK
jgi:mono/diheme cytochrome c family protein